MHKRPIQLKNHIHFGFISIGFNFAIVAGLFVGVFGWLLGRWRLSSASPGVPHGGGQRRSGAGRHHSRFGVVRRADRAARIHTVQEAVQRRTLLRTDRNGWIELSTAGEQMWVGVEMR